jgi:deoxyribose-phosphate aldolase
LEPLLIFGGRSVVADKLVEAEKAIQDGADDLDFVCNYEAFKMTILIWLKRY